MSIEREQPPAVFRGSVALHKLVLNRVLAASGVLLLVSTLLFFLGELSPVDPVALSLGDGATPQQEAARRSELGLDRPMLVRYAHWLAEAASGNLGRSYMHGQAVATELLRRLPVTLSLCLGAMIIALAVGLWAGIAAGLRPGSLPDRVITIFVSLGLALPGFWLGLLLAMAFAVHLRWFPVMGYTALTNDPIAWARGLILPCLGLSIHAFSVIARQVRGAVIEASGSPYVQTMRASGASARTISYRFVVANAMLPVLSVIGLQMTIIVSASVVMEQVFALPGLGSMLLEAIITNDMPLLQGGVLVVACFILLINLATDIMIGMIDPRTRPS